MNGILLDHEEGQKMYSFEISQRRRIVEARKQNEMREMSGGEVGSVLESVMEKVKEVQTHVESRGSRPPQLNSS